MRDRRTYFTIKTESRQPARFILSHCCQSNLYLLCDIFRSFILLFTVSKITKI